LEEDLPENYADLARRVYSMAEKEGWSKEKVFELLKDPERLVKKMEHVMIYSYYVRLCGKNNKLPITTHQFKDHNLNHIYYREN
jgi:hypothetical protein